jgi:hypothetical protein
VSLQCRRDVVEVKKKMARSADCSEKERVRAAEEDGSNWGRAHGPSSDESMGRESVFIKLCCSFLI